MNSTYEIQFQATFTLRQIGNRTWIATAASKGCSAPGNGSGMAVAARDACGLLVEQMVMQNLIDISPAQGALPISQSQSQPKPTQPQSPPQPPFNERYPLLNRRCLVKSGIRTIHKYCKPHGVQGTYIDPRDGVEVVIYLVSYEDGTPDGTEKSKFLVPQD